MKLKSLLNNIQKNEKHHKKLYFAAMVGLGLVLLFPVFFQIRYHELRSFGLISVFLLNFFGSATIFFPTPAFISVGISATQMSPLLVAFIGALGAALGEGTTFLFGLTSNKFFDLDKHKGLDKFRRVVFEKWKGAPILIFAFIPNPFFDGIGLLAGISKYPIKRFLVLTFIGRFARYLVIGYVSAIIAVG